MEQKTPAKTNRVSVEKKQAVRKSIKVQTQPVPAATVLPVLPLSFDITLAEDQPAVLEEIWPPKQFLKEGKESASSKSKPFVEQGYQCVRCP